MAKMTSATMVRESHPATIGALLVSPEARERMVREAAYYRSLQRGFAPGHDMEDWLAAEADVERSVRRRPPPEGGALPAQAPEEPGLQYGGAMGPAEDDALKRIVRGHPRRDIPRVESVEPEEAPPKQ